MHGSESCDKSLYAPVFLGIFNRPGFVQNNLSCIRGAVSANESRRCYILKLRQKVKGLYLILNSHIGKMSLDQAAKSFSALSRMLRQRFVDNRHYHRFKATQLYPEKIILL